EVRRDSLRSVVAVGRCLSEISQVCRAPIDVIERERAKIEHTQNFVRATIRSKPSDTPRDVSSERVLGRTLRRLEHSLGVVEGLLRDGTRGLLLRRCRLLRYLFRCLRRGPRGGARAI